MLRTFGRRWAAEGAGECEPRPSMVVGSGQFDCGRLFLFLINVAPLAE
jgi:hypothetical protein